MHGVSRIGGVGFGLIGIFFVMMIFFIASILPLIAFWKICSKAGFPPVLSLLMLVPVANFILPLYVGFTDWPVFKKTHEQETEK